VTNTRSPLTATAIRSRWVLGLTSTAYFMAVLDSLVVVHALPRIQEDLQVDLTALQWTINSYGIALAAGSIALLVAGVGVSMALPTVPTALLGAVPTIQLGKASGISYMAQRLGAVFAIAIGAAVFTAHGHLGNPTAVAAGFRPALWSAAVFAALAAASALAIPAPAHQITAPETTAHTDPADVVVAA